jgi:23S rRNA (uridine2552-2'-O)-methyltransferase
LARSTSSSGKPGGRGGKAGTGPGGRDLSVRVKTAKGRKTSSTRWLQRQLNDPYVVDARRRGYRSRSAFKLLELDERFSILKPGMRVLDLGAAPGGWTQVAIAAVNEKGARGKVVALDRTAIDPIDDAILLVGDVDEDVAIESVRAALGGLADVVLSDMAPASTGHPATDHLRIIALCESALAVAESLLAPGGSFVAKVLQGGTEGDLLVRMKTVFASVRHAKPPASRSDSAEMYVVATGFRGGKNSETV